MQLFKCKVKIQSLDSTTHGQGLGQPVSRSVHWGCSPPEVLLDSAKDAQQQPGQWEARLFRRWGMRRRHAWTTGVESGADEEEVRDACTEHCVSVVGAGLLPPRLLHSPCWPSSPFVPLCRTGKGPRGCLRMAAPALRVGLPRLKPLAEVSVCLSRRRSGLWGLVCLSIFVLLQINSKPSSQLVSQMELGPCQVLAPWFLNNSKATKRRGAAVETLEQQVPGASAATGTMAGVGWKGVCAQPVMREGLKLRHLQDLPQLSLQPEPELGILAVEARAFPRGRGWQG